MVPNKAAVDAASGDATADEPALSLAGVAAPAPEMEKLEPNRFGGGPEAGVPSGMELPARAESVDTPEVTSASLADTVVAAEGAPSEAEELLAGGKPRPPRPENMGAVSVVEGSVTGGAPRPPRPENSPAATSAPPASAGALPASRGGDSGAAADSSTPPADAADSSELSTGSDGGPGPAAAAWRCRAARAALWRASASPPLSTLSSPAPGSGLSLSCRSACATDVWLLVGLREGARAPEAGCSEAGGESGAVGSFELSESAPEDGAVDVGHAVSGSPSKSG